ncbi:Hypothetical predicted protein [Octopus vulgaris]|uniref:Uncharacterized protein n=1 Tax=Octopus vulgaris TaxID=6645 RepID=A0AA36C241_OCTVU|nr:Hypothetical predicted protein [Octopus vulgaris]
MGTRYTKKQILRKKHLLPASLRNKIRESTLQVFRDRLKSPGKGGALLVGNSANQTENCLVSSAPTVKDNSASPAPCSVKDPIPQETVNNSDSSLQSMAKRKRVRIKRKNLQRNQYKNTGCLKKYISQMTKINNMVSCNTASRRVRSPEKKISIIAENRITKYLGIFNRGRKSERIARVCPPIPKSVQDKADSDLKKILNITSDPRDVITITESDDGSQHGYHGNRETSQSFSQKAMTPTAEGAANTSSHLPEETNDLPQQTPYKEVAQDLLSTLHEKKKLFNQDLRLTISTQLYNLLRQSIQHSPVSKRETAPKCNRAASETTPPSALNKEKSLPSSTQHGHSKTPALKYPCIDQILLNACPQDDGKYLLMKNDYVIKIDENMNGSKKRIYQASSILPSRDRHEDGGPMHGTGNSKSHSCYLDPKYVRAQTESYKSVKNTVPWDKGLKSEFGIQKIWKSKKLVADVSLDYESGQSYEGMDSREGSGHPGHQCTETDIFSLYPQKFIEAGSYPEQSSEGGSYPCHLHQPTKTDSYPQQKSEVSNYCCHVHKSTEADSYLQRCTKTDERSHPTHIGCTEGPDFLQYLEQSSQGTISPESIATTVNYQLPKLKWNNTIFKAPTPDSDLSPFWLSEPSLPPLPIKPSLDNVVSPPGKLYPRKLY